MSMPCRRRRCQRNCSGGHPIPLSSRSGPLLLHRHRRRRCAPRAAAQSLPIQRRWDSANDTAVEVDDDDNSLSPLVDLGERFPDLFAQKLLVHLDPIDLTFLAQAGSACRAALTASDLPRAGGRVWVGTRVWVVRHKVWEFCTSVERLAWAKNNGCPWAGLTYASAAQGGRLEVMQWARDHDCQWDERTCASAAAGGHLEVLRWLREHGCPWDGCTH